MTFVVSHGAKSATALIDVLVREEEVRIEALHFPELGARHARSRRHSHESCAQCPACPLHRRAPAAGAVATAGSVPAAVAVAAPVPAGGVNEMSIALCLLVPIAATEY